MRRIAGNIGCFRLPDADNVSDEELCPCPCCGNRTLPERGQYFYLPGL